MGGDKKQAYTAICTADQTSINVRGKDLAHELIGQMDFISYFWFLLTGKAADANQSFMLNAALVAIAEHGLVPSNQVMRMTLASAPESFQGAVAAGLLGCGSVVFGSSYECGKLLTRLVAQSAADQRSYADTALSALQELRQHKQPVPGYGHPQHTSGDPRALRLLGLAKERGCAGPHVEMLETIFTRIPEVYSRSLPINVSGAIPAVMLDVGFPTEALKGIPLLARAGGLIAHLLEEIARPIGFALSGAAAKAVIYDGPQLNSNQ